MAILSDTEFSWTINNLVDLANSLPGVSPRRAFARIAKLLSGEHFGVESCTLDNFDDFSSNEPPSMRYLNMGDTYAETVILTDDYINGEKLIVSSWGDWYEQNEQHHCAESSVVRCGCCGHFTPFEYGSDDWRNHRCDHCGHNVSGGEYVPKGNAE